MTRTQVYKAIYLTTLLCGALAVLIFAIVAGRGHLPSMVVLGFAGMVLALLIPGRVLGYFWRVCGC